MMKFLGIYIRDNWLKYICILLWQGLLFLTFYLSGSKGEQLLYPMWLSLFVIIVYGVYDYIDKRAKHIKLEAAMEHIDLTAENLPAAVGIVERDYQQLIGILLEDGKNTKSRYSQLNQDTTEFITLWTHQVKTPLTALQLAMQELDAPDKGALTARLFEIEQYCDMILQYLRLEGSGTDYVLEKYQVRSMVNQSVKYFSRTFISKGLAVKVDIPEDAYIVTDEKWVVFALKQIISNALKYTERGMITIDMPAANSIRVTDTGIGISQEDLPRIFERGYTGFNGRRDKKATGIGLFLVKTIIEKLSGTVVIDSELGKGTSVTCNLTKL